MKAKIIFFAKVALMLALVLVLLGGVLSPQYSLGFNASILDKMDRLKTLEGPKLVLIGNSNLPFGMDSEMLEAEIGMPVVNMGLHGGMGNAFHEEMAKTNVQPGDIYVICHTEYNDTGDAMDPSLTWITIENHFGLWRLVRPEYYGEMKDAASTYVKKLIGLWVDGSGNEATEDAYSRMAFNQYGDDVYERPVQQYDAIDFSTQKEPYVEDACINRLNELNAYLTARGAYMVVAGYPIANGEFTPLVSVYEDFQAELEEKLDCPVISYFPEYMFDYQYFYDTLFHLTDEGVEMRTSILVEDLQLWLERRDAEDEAA